jgi:hypothetical protein
MADDDHKSEVALQREVDKACKRIEIGATYRHYKQKDYKVLRIAINESDMELTVVYQALYGPGLVFLRPVKAWLETVVVDGQKVPRFTKV